jgi:hypothetical protein
MRFVVLILALAGGAATGFLGYKWRSDYEGQAAILDAARQKAQGNPAAEAEFAKVDRLSKAAYFLLAGAPLGLIGGILAMLGRGKLAAVVLLLALVGPAVLAGPVVMEDNTLLGGFILFLSPLLLAGLLALTIRARPATAPS